MASSARDSTSPAGVSCIDVRTGTSFEFRARLLLSSGVLDSSWTPGAGQLCVGLLEGFQRNVLADGSGGVFVGWVDNRRIDPDIYLSRLTAIGERVNGWPADGLPVCQAALSQYQLDMASDGSGGVYLAWQDYRSGRLGQVFVQHVLAGGTIAPGWPADGRAVTDTMVEQSAPVLASDGSGGVYVVWQGRRGSMLGLAAQRLTSAGATASGWPRNGMAIGEGPGEQRAPGIASDSLGRALLVWQQADMPGTASLVATRLDPGTSPEAGWDPPIMTLTPLASDLSEPVVVSSGAAMLVAWAAAGNASGILAQRIGLDGMIPAWPAGGLSLCQGPVSLDSPVVLPDAQGGYVAWGDLRSGSSSDIFVQRFTAAGTIAPGWPADGVPLAAGAGDEYAPWLASDGAGGALVTWSEPTLIAAAGFFSLTRLLQGAVPRLVEAVARPNLVRIVWRVAPALRESLEAERRLVDAEWMPFARVAADDSGRVVLLDRTAPEGAHVEYRLGIRREDAQVYFEPVGLDVPLAPVALALHRAWFSAPRHALVLAFGLPAGVPPAVEVIDVTGRRVERQVLDGLDPGEHEAVVRLSRTLRSGVYFVRLIQAGQIRVAKAALVR